MPSVTRSNARLLAHHLYEFVECEHRVALDATVDRAERTPPGAAMEMLFEHGRAFEREVAAGLRYPTVEVRGDDWEGAFEETVALMRSGVAGIDQGVLLGPGRLARPDLLERVPGASGLGEFHYVPGDIKSALAPRSDAAMQVGFAAVLLEAVQGVRPSSGFLILGDGSREVLDLESIRTTVDEAVMRAESLVLGEAATVPGYCRACARCRWRGRCLPELEKAHDISFVHGLTRTRQRVLRARGVESIDALAAADIDVLVASGVPADGLDRAQRQARALLSGGVEGRREVPVPSGSRRELYLRIETDPLDGAQPFLVSWGEARIRGALETARGVVVSSVSERADVADELIRFLEGAAVVREPVYVFGGQTSRALEALCDLVGLAPARAGDLLGRLVDLAPWVRRGGVLPVFRYSFAEVAAVARRMPRPALDAAEDDLFVIHAGIRDGAEGASARRDLESAGREAVGALHAIRRWLDR
ncbi:MAG TPA: TM0106 family RecB-like putative nuclease [Candidatus Sulfotelmatobacter sp.]|jgi:predicted RecB family nuclease|nr:TM0106 family RecB-like putative nuclease [Candidatus Sulfotelmatobacter sp.]